MPHPLRVLVRASDPITRAGLAAQLDGRPDIEITTEPAVGGPEVIWQTPARLGASPSGGPTAATAVLAAPATSTRAAAHRVAPPAGSHGHVRGPARPESPESAASIESPGSASRGMAGAAPVDVALVGAQAVDEEALRTIREMQQGGVPVVLVAADLDSHDLTAAIDAGVVGLLRRGGATPETVLTAVRGAAAGEGYLPPDLLGPLLKQVRQVSTQVLAPRGLTFSGLTERELTVLRLVSEGFDTREIGIRLCYSERTVKNVLQDVTRRFGLRNRSHAVAYAFRHGLL